MYKQYLYAIGGHNQTTNTNTTQSIGEKSNCLKEMTKPLFSIPVVCDGRMDVTFTKHDV
jgi:hypothetical protein